MAVQEPKSEALRGLFWRDEILEVVLWLRGEGFDEHVDAATVERFLGLEASRAVGLLEQMAADRLLRRLAGHRYALAERGEKCAQRLIGAAWTNRPHDGPCGPVCWCELSPLEATVCAGGPGQHDGTTSA